MEVGIKLQEIILLVQRIIDHVKDVQVEQYNMDEHVHHMIDVVQQR